MANEVRTICPICGTTYSAACRSPGTECLDLSQGQKRYCVGRVMRMDKYERAEWRNQEAKPCPTA